MAQPVGLLFLILAVLMIIGAVLGVRGLLMRGRLAAKGEPRCGRCGYDVRAAASFTCPECGSDLRQVGILTPDANTRRPTGVVGLLVAWTFYFLLLAAPLAALAFLVAPQQTLSTERREFSGPVSGAYRSVTVEQRERAITWLGNTVSHSEAYEFTIEPRGLVGGLRIDDATTYRYAAGSNIVSGAVTSPPAVIQTWLEAAASVPTGDPQIAREANELWSQRPASGSQTWAMLGNFNSSGSRLSSGQSGTHPAVLVVLLLIFGGLWILGAYAVVRPKLREKAA